MFEIPSPASSSDGEKILFFEELLEETSLAVQGAANTCSCGERKADVMDVFHAGVTWPASFCGTLSKW